MKKQCETDDELQKCKARERESNRKYRETKRKQRQPEKELEHNSTMAERKRKGREVRRQCETEQESLECRYKEAEYKRKYRETRKQWQCEESKQKEKQSNRKCREYKRKIESAEQLLHQRQKDAACKRKAYAQKKKPQLFLARKGLDNFDESSIAYENVGSMSFTCSQCGALMFKGEKSGGSLSGENPTAKFSLCCSNGEIKLPPIKEPPEKLKCLLTGNTKKDCDFRTNIRGYNSSLAFASMCVSGEEYKFKTNGPYCYRISGQVYHALSQMQPEPGRKPSFSQIYIYDQEHELDN